VNGVYKALIDKIFFDRYRKGATRVAFDREDLPTAAGQLKIVLPKNLGGCHLCVSLSNADASIDPRCTTQGHGMDY
jgi:hypothetical protein